MDLLAEGQMKLASLQDSTPFVWRGTSCYTCHAADPAFMCSHCHLSYFCSAACQRRGALSHAPACKLAARRAALRTVLRLCAGDYGLSGSVLAFLTQTEALVLRPASRACCDAVARHAWSDLQLLVRTTDLGGAHIKGSLASWRRCFPHAISANVRHRKALTDDDFQYLRGLRTLAMRNCRRITDAGLSHLSGIHTLDMYGCKLVTDAGLAHLSGIHTLNVGGCTRVSDAGLAHLRGIHTLRMADCELVTDAGLAHLSGIHTLDMSYCAMISDSGLAHLRGIRKLRAHGCPQLTRAGLAQLEGAEVDDEGAGGEEEG